MSTTPASIMRYLQHFAIANRGIISLKKNYEYMTKPEVINLMTLSLKYT
jgi:hypothetical protein